MRSNVINRYRNIGQRTDQTHGIHGTESNNRREPWLETQGEGNGFQTDWSRYCTVEFD